MKIDGFPGGTIEDPQKLLSFFLKRVFTVKNTNDKPVLSFDSASVETWAGSMAEYIKKYPHPRRTTSAYTLDVSDKIIKMINQENKIFQFSNMSQMLGDTAQSLSEKAIGNFKMGLQSFYNEFLQACSKNEATTLGKNTILGGAAILLATLAGALSANSPSSKPSNDIS